MSLIQRCIGNFSPAYGSLEVKVLETLSLLCVAVMWDGIMAHSPGVFSAASGTRGCPISPQLVTSQSGFASSSVTSGGVWGGP